MIVGFTGAQAGLTGPQRIGLRIILGGYVHPGTFVHGDCIGADAEAHEIAVAGLWVIQIFPCNIRGKRAFKPAAYISRELGPLTRNRIIAEGCDLLIACPGGPEKVLSGTWATVRYARKASKPITLIWPDGAVTRENVS